MMEILSDVTKIENILKLVFYGILLLPVVFQIIFGCLRGFKKTMWKLVIYAIYMAVFFITLNKVSELLFTKPLFGLPAMLNSMITQVEDTSILTLQDFSHSLMNYLLESNAGSLGTSVDISTISSNVYIIALFEGLVLYSIKVIWSTLYFILVVPIFCILTRLLIYNVFLKGKKDQKKLTKDPFLGLVSGSLYGLLKAFVLMIYIGGFISLINYTGEIASVTEGVKNSAETTEAKEQKTDDTLKLSNNYEIEELGLTSGLGDAGKIVNTVVNVIKTVNDTWNNNFLVKMANNVYYEEEVETGEVDENGEPKLEKQRVEVLDKCFDEIVYFKYEIDTSSLDEGRNELLIKVNFIDDMNSFIQMIMYILDDPDVFQTRDDGSTQINLANLKSERVEKAFSALSENNMMKVLLSVGISIALDTVGNSLTAVDLKDPDFQNQLYNTDFTDDLTIFGQFLGGLVDLGLGKFLSDMINKQLDTSNYANYLNVFNPVQKDDETDAQYNERVNKAREKVVDSVENFNLIKLGSSLVSTYLIENLLKSQIESLGLNDDDINAVEGTTEYKSYKENLVNSIKLNDDLGLIFELLFDCADFQKDGKLQAVIDKYTNKEAENIISVSNDEIAEFMNTILTDFSNISFLQATLDIGVKIAIEKINNENIKKHLTLENIFSDYIDWKEQIGEKIPNLVEAIITNEVIDIFTGGKDIAAEIFNLDSFSGVFEDTIEALFELQLISNLEDTCLTPLLQDLIGSMAGDSLTIKMSSDLGKEGHKYKDEILSFISIFDDLMDGAKENGCTSFDNLFSDLTNVIKGIGKVDSKKLANSAILGPTMAYFLSTFENDTLVCPYIYEDKSWYTTVNEEGETLVKGELECLVDAIKGIVDNDAVISLISGKPILDDDGNEKSTLDLITEFGDKELENLFKSAIIKATVTKLLSSFNSDSFKIVIPSTAKEEIVITKYSEDDVTNGNVVLTSDTVTKEDETIVYKAKAKYLSEQEFNSVVRAIKQIGDLEGLMGGTLDLNIVKNFKGGAVDGYTHDHTNPEDKYKDWCYVHDDDGKVTNVRKTKIDVIFESEVLRCTLSHFFTGDNYESEYFVFPKNELEFIDDFYYIKHDSICSLFTSVLSLLDNADISDLTNIGSSLVNDILTIDNNTLDEMFESKILAATLSNVIMKVEALSIPQVDGYIDSEDCFPMTSETTYTLKYVISKEEFKALFKSISICFPDSFNLDADFNINEILSNLLELGYLNGKGITSRIDTFYSSKIFEATLAKYITGVSALTIPEDAVETYQKIKYDSTLGTFSLESAYKLTISEERSLLTSLEKLFPYKNGGLTGDIANVDYTSLIGNIITLSKGELETLFSSKILNATISNTLLGVSAIVIPTDVVTDAKYIKNNALTDSSDIVKVITYTDTAQLINSLSYIFGDNVDINNIGSDMINDILKLDNNGLATLFSSKILSATISKTLLEQDAIIVPYKANLSGTDYTPICTTSEKVVKSGDTYTTSSITEINQEQLKNLLSALNILFNGSVDFNSIGIDTFKNLSRLDSDKLTSMTASLILNATISDKLSSAFGSSSSTKVIIPSNVTLKYSMSDDTSDPLYMVDGDEIKSLIKAMGYFDFDSFGSSGDGDQFSTFKELAKESGELVDSANPASGYKSQIRVILESQILHATMSNILLSMSTGGSLALLMPSTIKDTTTAVEIENKKLSTTEVIFISSGEVENMLNALNYLDVTKFGAGSDIFNTLKGLLDPIHLNVSTRKIDKILESDILRATISNYLFDLNTGSIDILVPNDTTNVLDVECDNLVKNAKQAKVRMIKDEELIRFIEGVSSLDLDALGGSDIGNTVKSLSNKSTVNASKSNIEMINDSYILQVSFSNFLINNLSKMGFKGFAIPASSLSAIKVLKLTTDSNDIKNFVLSDEYTLNNIEEDLGNSISEDKQLIYFVNSMKYLDLNAISSDTLNAIASLNSEVSAGVTKLDKLFESNIMKYTLSAQILEFSGYNGTTWNFIIPEQALENGGFILDTSLLDFESKIKTTSQILINTQDLKDLIGALGVVDLTKLDASMLMNIEESKFNQLITSKIFLANASDKFKLALGSNNTKIGTPEKSIGSFATADNLYSTTLTYRAVPNDSTNKVKVIKKEELSDIYNSMKIMGTGDLGSFNIGLDTLGNFTDDGRTDNDDDRANDAGDSRAKFLRSLFIRSLIFYILNDSTHENVSDITTHMESLYGNTYVLTAKTGEIPNLIDDLDLDLDQNGNLSWTAVTLRKPNTGEEYAGTYPPIKYTVTINGKAKTSQTTTSLDISSDITNYGLYTITVKAEIDDSDTSNTALIAFKAANLKPLSKPLSYAKLENVYKFVSGSVSSSIETLSQANDNTTITDYKLANDKIVFTKVDNATDYLITIYKVGGTELASYAINSNKDTIELDLKGQLPVGKYYYTIKASSNVTYSGGKLYNDSVTTNSSEFRVTETITDVKAEIIGNTLYITKNSSEIKGMNVTIGGKSVVNTYENITGVGERYKVDLSKSILANGLNDIIITPQVDADLYKANQVIVKFNNIATVSSVTLSLDSTNGDNVVINKVSGAKKYIVRINRIVDSQKYLQLYKEIVLDSTTDPVKLSASNLFKGYEYEVNVTPIDTENAYVSTTYTTNIKYAKALETVTKLNISDDSSLTISTVGGADSYDVTVYTKVDTNTYTEVATNTYTAGMNLISEFNLDITKDYYVAVTAKSISDLYTDSLESVKKKFSATEMDRVYDLEYDKATNSLIFSDVDTDGDNYTYKVIAKAKDADGNFTIISATSVILAPSDYTVVDGKITISIDSLASLFSDDYSTYKLFIYTEALNSCYKESKASLGIKYTK